jgi:enterochelin esterase family protein
MSKKRTAAAAVAIGFLMGFAAGTLLGLINRREATESEDLFDSPRLAALADALKAGDQGAMSRFWAEMEGKGPLVEPMPKQPGTSLVTFVWRGDSDARRVNVQGGPCSGDFANWMKRLGDTDLWYRTDPIPNDSRFAYFFQVDRPLRFPPHAEKLPPLAPPQADPLNPRKNVLSNRSIVEMPDAPPEPWLARRPGAGAGALMEHRLTSEIIRAANPGFDHERRFAVYTPPGYNPAGPAHGLLILFDGNGCREVESDMPTTRILENLAADGTIPSLVTLFIYQSRERDRELGCSEPFAQFLVRELLPWVRKNYHVASEPARVVIGGMSAGGRQAAFCGLRHSEAFGNVLSLSGGFEWWPGALEEKLDDEPGWLTRQFVTAPTVPVRFYLAAGRFEHWFFPSSLLHENWRLRDVLRAKGYDVTYNEFSGGHDPVCWRGPFVDGLRKLIGRQTER